MPTASEFETMARRLDELIRWVGGPLSAVGFANQGVCVGGRLEDLVQRTIDDAGQRLGVAVDGCGVAADRARERAAACRRYTAAMSDYRAAIDRIERQQAAGATMPGTAGWPSRPIRPGPWADEG